MSVIERPIHLLTRRMLDAVGDTANAALALWASNWLPATATPPTARPDAADAGDAVDACFEELVCEHGSAWVRRSDADRAALVSAALGAAFDEGPAPCLDEWAAGVVDRACEARDDALCRAVLGPLLSRTDRHPPQRLFGLGSGATLLSAPSIGLFVLVDCAALQCVPPRERSHRTRLASLAPLDQAVGTRPVTVTATVGDVQLALARLLDLQCGDVLRLPTRIDQPLALMCATHPVSRVVLGTRGNSKCVQIVNEQA